MINEIMYNASTENSFRPLSGSYISQSSILILQLQHLVSVPYRGATFLNVPQQGRRLSQFLFPSPIGELHFSIRILEILGGYSKVSVPYRGATFLNKDLNTSRFGRISVSVPYRGATFLNKVTDVIEKFQNSFRPLSGSYISQ